tara:strand:- start:278 stop:577 length:300 start_codon:yes stop_codon:yes gene_type:complete
MKYQFKKSSESNNVYETQTFTVDINTWPYYNENRDFKFVYKNEGSKYVVSMLIKRKDIENKDYWDFYFDDDFYAKKVYKNKKKVNQYVNKMVDYISNKI